MGRHKHVNYTLDEAKASLALLERVKARQVTFQEILTLAPVWIPKLITVALDWDGNPDIRLTPKGERFMLSTKAWIEGDPLLGYDRSTPKSS